MNHVTCTDRRSNRRNFTDKMICVEIHNHVVLREFRTDFDNMLMKISV